MRIAFFTDTFAPQINGVVTANEVAKRSLEGAGHEVVVFAPRIPGAEQPGPQVVTFPSVPSPVYPDLRESLPVRRGILSLLPSLGVDVVHIHTPGEIGLLGLHLARRHRLPLIFSFHTLYPEHFRIYGRRALISVILGLIVYPLAARRATAYPRLAGIVRRAWASDDRAAAFIRELLLLASREMDAIVAPSTKVKQLLTAWGSDAPVVVVPYAVDLADLPAAVDRGRERLGLPGSAPVIVYVGRLGAEKNIPVLLEAHRLVLAELPDARLLIVGDGPLGPRLHRRAEELGISGRVVFTGPVEHARVMETLDAGDVFVHPSLTETLGVATLEAAARGLPLVMTDPDLGDLLEDGGNGRLARDDPADVASKILEILGDPELRDRMGRRSLEVAARFDASRVIPDLVDVYEDAIASGPRHARRF